MKKLTKLLTAITSLAILSSSVTAIPSNAFSVTYIEGEAYEEMLTERGYTEFNDFGIFLWVATGVAPDDGYTLERYLEKHEPYRCFYKDNWILISETPIMQSPIVISVPVESDDEELIASVFDEIIPDWSYIKNAQSVKLDGVYKYILQTDCTTEEAYEKGLLLCAELNQYNIIEEFKFYGRAHYENSFNYPTDKLYFEAENFDEAAISQHLDSYDISYEINPITEAEIPLSNYSGDETAYTITLSDESTWQDYVYVKSLINEKFDVGIDYAVPEGSGELNSADIDILSQINSSYGDLNNNGSIDMSDAVALMANVSNPEEYPLTDLQLLLGDVYQQGDGVGINDAVSVQKYLTKQINSLPESTI